MVAAWGLGESPNGKLKYAANEDEISQRRIIELRLAYMLYLSSQESTVLKKKATLTRHQEVHRPRIGGIQVQE